MDSADLAAGPPEPKAAVVGGAWPPAVSAVDALGEAEAVVAVDSTVAVVFAANWTEKEISRQFGGSICDSRYSQ